MKPGIKKFLERAAKVLQFGTFIASVAYAIAVWPPAAIVIPASLIAVVPAVFFFRKLTDRKKFPASASPLKPEEISLVKSVFGPKVKLAKVKKYFSAKENKVGEATVDAITFGKKAVKFYGNDNYADDFSKADPDRRSLFMHEMTHVIQNKRPLRDLFNSLVRTKQYAYDLTEKSHYKRFGVEQQASIIEDYTRHFLQPGGYRPQTTYWPAATTDKIKDQSAALLKKVVEEQFPEARKTRLALEAQEPGYMEMLDREIRSKSKRSELSWEVSRDLDRAYDNLRNTDIASFVSPPKNSTAEKIVQLMEESSPSIRESRLKLTDLYKKKLALEEQLKATRSASAPAPRVA